MLNDDNASILHKIIDYIIQIKEDGGDAICPIYSAGNQMFTIQYFFVMPKFCIKYTTNDDIFNKLVVFDGTYNISETKGTIIIFATVTSFNTYNVTS